MADEDTQMKSETAERAGDMLRVRREAPDPAIRRAPMSPPVPPQPQPDRRGETLVRERTIRRPLVIRGGIAPFAILTGVLVALGATLLFMAIAAGLLAATGVIGSGTVDTPSIVRATVLTGVGLVVAQFLAFLWGGYAAGRMARGAGTINGFMVPLMAIIIAGGVGILVNWLGTTVHLNYAFQTTRFPTDHDLKLHLGYGLAGVSVFAMFVGGMVGGVRGVWWHRKLEAPAMLTEMEKER